MSTQCEHGQLARQCLLCEQAAEIEVDFIRHTGREQGSVFIEGETERPRLVNKK